jgi:exodeoxyribonuclease V alpha subunit
MTSAEIRERAIDRALERWVRVRSGSPRLAVAAYLASRDEGEGHSCTRFDDETGFDVAGIEELSAHPWVGDGTRFTPFVLVPDGSFYTWRNWSHETCLAAKLRARAEARSAPVAPAALQTDVEELFSGVDAVPSQRQREAVAAGPGSRLLVVTGGAGTGKTTTVLRVLLELLRRAEECGLPKRPSIALAAPTGKAAQRLGEALGRGRQALLDSLPAHSVFRALLDAIPYAQAQTLHRLLRYNPHDNSFAHGAESPLPADIVVVDETSMIDLAMMRQLADAVRPDAILILLGDPGQLYAVQAGSVLGDIVAAASESSPLSSTVIELDHVWRSAGGLQRGIAALRRGDLDQVGQLLGGDDESLRWHDVPKPGVLREQIAAWCDRHAQAFDTLMRRDVDPREALAALRSMQILCALREGAFGADGVNAAVTRMLAERYGFDGEREWHHGRSVIILRNDYARDLYNGDVGIALESAEGLRVWFEVRDRDGNPDLRNLSVRTLPEHDSAWAITIHRSQGSEYGEVAVVLPPEADHRILSRELLYTAVSRATMRAEIWTSAGALRAAATRPVLRRGGLRGMLGLSRTLV